MEAVKSDINTILAGNKQFAVPVYQRRYSWEGAQCRRLWEDIVRMHRAGRKGHFVGSIVNIAEPARLSGGHGFMIIDGQQRLATLTVLLIAVRDHLNDQPKLSAVAPDEITASLLKVPEGVFDTPYKLILGQADDPVLQALIESRPLPVRVHSRLLDAYRFFRERIMESDLLCEEILVCVGRLQLVDITLDRYDDDPQLIFESLNSTGVDLSQSDLIRNYVLIGLPPEKQREVYETLWLPMEGLFDYAKQTQLMDRFLRDYITMQLGRIPKVDRVYEAFKQLHPLHLLDAPTLCADLLRFARYYTDLYYCKSDEGKWDDYFCNIKSLQMEVSYPFLLRVYADHDGGKLTDEEFREILQLCESYVLRRAICEIPTNSLNKTFATIKNELKEEDYVASIKAFFLTRESYKEFPADDRFMAALKVRDIDNMRIRGHILQKLATVESDTGIDPGRHSIEHILPVNQNLSLEWRRMLGTGWREIQRNWAHTIGNLTMVGYSADMTDRPFAEKLEMPGGIQEMGLRMDKTVTDKKAWDLAAIQQRAEDIAQLALQVWPAPHLPKDKLRQYLPREKVEQYTPDSYDFNAFTKILFEHLDNRINALSPLIRRECRKLYISYRYETSFVDVVVQRTRLRLVVNLLMEEVDDPSDLCRPAPSIGRWGEGEVEIFFESLEQLDAVMKVVEQALEKQVGP